MEGVKGATHYRAQGRAVPSILLPQAALPLLSAWRNPFRSSPQHLPEQERVISQVLPVLPGRCFSFLHCGAFPFPLLGELRGTLPAVRRFLPAWACAPQLWTVLC